MSRHRGVGVVSPLSVLHYTARASGTHAKGPPASLCQRSSTTVLGFCGEGGGERRWAGSLSVASEVHPELQQCSCLRCVANTRATSRFSVLSIYSHTTFCLPFGRKQTSKSLHAPVPARFLALHCVSQNQNAFQDFMLHAAPVTRQQRQVKHGCVPFFFFFFLAIERSISDGWPSRAPQLFHVRPFTLE